MRGITRGLLAGGLALAVVATPFAQEPKSAALATELAAALSAAKLDAIGAKDPSQPDVYVAALYFSGSQFLVVSARYAVPQYLNERLIKKEYRDMYLDLSSASVPETKVFVEDSGADGLKARRENNRGYDSVESGGKRTMFNNEWRDQKLSEDEYMAAFAKADEAYAKMLQALLDQVKRSD